MPHSISWVNLHPSKNRTKIEVVNLAFRLYHNFLLNGAFQMNSVFFIYQTLTRLNHILNYSMKDFSIFLSFLCEYLRRIWTSLHWVMSIIFLIFCNRNGLQNREWFHLLNFMFSMLNNHNFWVHKYWDKKYCQYEIYSPHVWCLICPQILAELSVCLLLV